MNLQDNATLKQSVKSENFLGVMGFRYVFDAPIMDMGNGVFEVHEANGGISTGSLTIGTDGADPVKEGMWETQLPNGHVLKKEYKPGFGSIHRENVYSDKGKRVEGEAWFDKDLLSREEYSAKGRLISRKEFHSGGVTETFKRNKRSLSGLFSRIKKSLSLEI